MYIMEKVHAAEECKRCKSKVVEAKKIKITACSKNTTTYECKKATRQLII